MGLSGAITWRGVWAALPALLQEADSLKTSRALELGAGCGLLVPQMHRPLKFHVDRGLYCSHAW